MVLINKARALMSFRVLPMYLMLMVAARIPTHCGLPGLSDCIRYFSVVEQKQSKEKGVSLGVVSEG